MEADEENWDLNAVTTAAEADGSGPRGRFHGLHNECLAVKKKLAGLSDFIQMAKCSITLEMKLRESDWEMPKTHHELKVAIGAGVEALSFCFEYGGGSASVPSTDGRCKTNSLIWPTRESKVLKRQVRRLMFDPGRSCHVWRRSST